MSVSNDFARSGGISFKRREGAASSEASLLWLSLAFFTGLSGFIGLSLFVASVAGA